MPLPFGVCVGNRREKVRSQRIDVARPEPQLNGKAETNGKDEKINLQGGRCTLNGRRLA